MSSQPLCHKEHNGYRHSLLSKKQYCFEVEWLYRNIMSRIYCVCVCNTIEILSCNLQHSIWFDVFKGMHSSWNGCNSTIWAWNWSKPWRCGPSVFWTPSVNPAEVQRWNWTLEAGSHQPCRKCSKNKAIIKWYIPSPTSHLDTVTANGKHYFTFSFVK